jgi:hypothetical protein
MRYWAVLVILVACGDNEARDLPFDAVSGTRLKVERYMFDDGTSLPGATGYFDGELHVRCTAQTWVDGVMRCVPDAEDALFSDNACMTAIGRGMLITKPKVFVGHDIVHGGFVPSHVYKAGEPIEAPDQYYQRVDGACAGPFFTPSDYVYYQLTGEYDPPIELTDSVVGDGRIALRIRTSSDGAITPLALFDRDLAVDCEPAGQADGSAVCEPVAAPIATLFAEPTCTQPVVALPDSSSQQPLVARYESAANCATYHALGPELTTSLYRLDRGSCVGAPRISSVHYVPLTEPASLASIERAVEPSARRLHRIIASTDDVVAYGSRLVDNAIRAECARVAVGELERCLPTNTITAIDLYAPGCAQRMRVTAVPTHSCREPAFAVSLGEHAAVSAIGDVTTQVVYRIANDGTCRLYTPSADEQLRTLGPPLPEDTFLAARPYGER